MQPAIRIPQPFSGGQDWVISGPWLKLSLKYGIVGPWGMANGSVAYDRYCLTRGPQSGPPLITDFAMTTLMNSRVNSNDLSLAENWLRKDGNRQRLSALSTALASCQGLQDMPETTLVLLAETMNAVQQLKGIKTAKVAKWFSAWAPAHVPMVDQWVLQAMIGKNVAPAGVTWMHLLNTFKQLVTPNMALLTHLGRHLAVAAGLSAPVPPVRVLDGLIWFDWWACSAYQNDFLRWLNCEETPEGYVLTDEGRAIENTFPGSVPIPI